MLPCFSIRGITIHSYGLMAALALIAANASAFPIIRRKGISAYEIMLLEAYMLLGALLGSKLLYLAVSFREIDWRLFLSSFDYFSALLNSGFVFYGGLIGGIASFFLGAHIHGCDGLSILDDFIYAVPLAHGIGRIGCFLSGCCYGVEYDGILAVHNAYLPYTVFPVQLLEAALLFILSAYLLMLTLRNARNQTRIYLLSYSAIRFMTEFFRADAARGRIGGLSLSQAISLAILISVIISFPLIPDRDQNANDRV